MKSIVGVDLGSRFIRVAEVTGVDRDGMAIVRRLGIAPVKEGAIIGGEIRQPQLVSIALARAFKEAGVRPRGFILGFSSPDVVIGQVLLPAAVKPSERIGAIRHMQIEFAANQSAVPLAQAEISTQHLATALDHNGAAMDTLLVAAASQDRLAELINVCRLAKATPRAIDISGAATLRGIVRCGSDLSEVSTVIDIGHTKTAVITRQGPYLRSLRTINGGGAKFTQAVISSLTNDDEFAAERRKKTLRIETQRAMAEVANEGLGYLGADSDAPASGVTFGQTQVEEAVDRYANQLVDQIAGAVEADANAFERFSSGAVLCGGGSLMPGLKELLARRLGLPVIIGTPFARLERNRHTELHFQGEVEDPETMLSLTTAVGLGLWKNPNEQ